MLKQKLPQENQPSAEFETKSKQAEEIKLKAPDLPAGLPSLTELDEILAEARKAAKIAQMSEEEIDKMLAERQAALDKVKDIDLLKTERLKQLEEYEPLAGLTVEDYNRLVEEEIISADYVEKLKETDDLIEKLQSLKSLTVKEEATLEELKQLRSSCRQFLQSQIEEKRQLTINRLDKIKNKMAEHYQNKIKKLEKVIEKAEENPRALARLYDMAKQEMAEHEEKIRQEEEKKLKEITRFIQSLSARQANALNRLRQVVKNENLKDDLLQALEERDSRKQQSSFDKIRSQVIKAIIAGTGEEQIKEAKEVVPWETKSSVNYYFAFNQLLSREVKTFLKAKQAAGDEQAQNLLKQIDQIVMADSALHKLFGKKWIKDKKTGKKRLGAFWWAFAERKKNDKEKLIKARKEEKLLEAKEEKELEEKIKEIIKRGGFIVKVPIYKKIKGERQLVGAHQGAVRLKRIKTKWGKDCWQVVETLGAAKKIIKIGATSTLDMAFFPSPLKTAAEHYFIKDENGNFIERIGLAAQSKEEGQEK